MRPLLKILLYLVLVVLAGVVISPPAYWACQWLISQGWFEFLRDFPFHRYFSRTVQVAALVLLVPFALWTGIRSPRDLGLQPNSRRWADFFAGGGVALGVFAVLALGYLYSGLYAPRPTPEWTKLARIAATAVFVAVFEEAFFRGVLLGLAGRWMGAWWGVLTSSAIFAAAHFLRPAKLADAGPVTWSSGWEQALTVFSGAPPMPLLAYGAATLFLSGCILAAATLRTRSLWLPIGLHTGWIFSQQAFSLLSKSRIRPPEEMLPWVGPSLVSGAVPTGLVPLAALAITGGLAWLVLRRRSC